MMTPVQFCISGPSKGHLRSHADVMRLSYIFCRVLLIEEIETWDRRQCVCTYCPDSSTDMQYDLLGLQCDPDLRSNFEADLWRSSYICFDLP